MLRMCQLPSSFRKIVSALTGEFILTAGLEVPHLQMTQAYEQSETINVRALYKKKRSQSTVSFHVPCAVGI